MSRFFSDYWIPEDRGILTQSACRHCRHRKECPCSRDHVFEDSLRRAASQGKAAAHLLTAEAERLLDAISCADSSGRLLSANEALERTLSEMLHAETALIQSLSV